MAKREKIKIAKVKEYEYKYKIDVDKVDDLIRLIKKKFPKHLSHTLVYTDTYYIASKFKHDTLVPNFLRVRIGKNSCEVTTKSLLGCGPDERNEQNAAVKDPTQIKQILSGLDYEKLVTLQKACEFITAEGLWLTLDRVNGDAYYFEIEVADPTSKEEAFRMLTEAEGRIGLKPEDRIEDLLFEIYTAKRLVRTH